jgi:hypothetical protein
MEYNEDLKILNEASSKKKISEILKTYNKIDFDTMIK